MLAISLQKSELGDFICTEGDCQIGQALIEAMQAFYGSALDKAAYPNDFTARFKPSIDALVTAFNDADGSFWRHLPFAAQCCTIKELGNKAQQLTQQMATYLNIAAPTPTDTHGTTSQVTDFFSNLAEPLKIVAWVAGLGMATYIGIHIYRAINE